MFYYFYKFETSDMFIIAVIVLITGNKCHIFFNLAYTIDLKIFVTLQEKYLMNFEVLSDLTVN